MVYHVISWQMTCSANPFDFVCGCKSGRKIGVCAHILLVTHEEMKSTPKDQRKAICNLHYMVGQIAGVKKAVGNPKTVKHCLLREDSSDDDDGLPLTLMW